MSVGKKLPMFRDTSVPPSSLSDHPEMISSNDRCSVNHELVRMQKHVFVVGPGRADKTTKIVSQQLVSEV